jgi:hypothetical protein
VKKGSPVFLERLWQIWFMRAEGSWSMSYQGPGGLSGSAHRPDQTDICWRNLKHRREEDFGSE